MKRSDVYKAIRDKLLSDIGNLTVDVNRGQMNNPKADYPIPLPLALVSVSSIRWKTISSALQSGNVTILVDYFKVICQDTFSGAEAEDEALMLLDSPDDVYLSLQGFEAPGLLGEVRRTEEKQLVDEGRVIGYRIAFEADVFDF